MESNLSLNGIPHFLEIRRKSLDVSSLQGSVMGGMCIRCGKYIKILWSVIATYLIDMVDSFVVVKEPSNKIFDNNYMLENVPSVRSSMPRSFLCEVSETCSMYPCPSFPRVRVLSRMGFSVLGVFPSFFCRLPYSFFRIFTKRSTFLSFQGVPSASVGANFPAPLRYLAGFTEKDGITLQATALDFGGFHRWLQSITSFNSMQIE